MTIETAAIGFWVALTFWVIAFLIYLYGLLFRRQNLLMVAVVIAAIGLVPHLAGTVVRWIASGRPPYISLYELVAASAWFAVATYLATQAIWRNARPVGVAVMPVAFLALGWALTLSPEANPLGAALKSWWLVVHILFALIAHGAFVVAFSAGVMLFVKEGEIQPEVENSAPSPGGLDQLGARCIAFGFICHTIMVLSGAIWANRAWGRYWGWDPIETWSLVTWLLYGLYIHLRFLPKWRGKLAAAYAIMALPVVIFSFWIVPHIWKSIHDYSIYTR